MSRGTVEGRFFEEFERVKSQKKQTKTCKSNKVGIAQGNKTGPILGNGLCNGYAAEDILSYIFVFLFI
jgi:hypothetical protein